MSAFPGLEMEQWQWIAGLGIAPSGGMNWPFRFRNHSWKDVSYHSIHVRYLWQYIPGQSVISVRVLVSVNWHETHKHWCVTMQATIGIDFLSKTMYLDDRTIRLQLCMSCNHSGVVVAQMLTHMAAIVRGHGWAGTKGERYIRKGWHNSVLDLE